MEQIKTQDVWISVDEKRPGNGQVIKVLFEDKKEDISKYCEGEFYIIPDWDDIKSITHWKPTRDFFE